MIAVMAVLWRVARALKLGNVDDILEFAHRTRVTGLAHSIDGGLCVPARRRP
jgi:hypothetical protein